MSLPPLELSPHLFPLYSLLFLGLNRCRCDGILGLAAGLFFFDGKPD